MWLFDKSVGEKFAVVVWGLVSLMDLSRTFEFRVVVFGGLLFVVMVI